ncbi:5'-nucleotidase [Dyadobacter sp. 676]|uniref:5'-nucleotidase n=1 Tax=Dyadobacter sp. 676 TaxID=3088362 RepID=A0AAU8FKY5_9BACT
MKTSVRRVYVAVLLASLGLPASCRKHLVITKSEYKQYGIDRQVGADSAIIRYYQPYKDKMQKEMDRVVGQTEAALTKPPEPETLMGNFFADAILREGLKKDPAIQFALATKGGLRTTFPKGNITVSHVYELMPFENELVVLKLSGGDVRQVVDFIARKGGEPVAGIRMKIRDGRAYDVTIGGQPFDSTQTYHVLTYDYLADGGDELECLRHPLERREINQRVREALFEYIGDLTRQGKKITARLDGRIISDK